MMAGRVAVRWSWVTSLTLGLCLLQVLDAGAQGRGGSEPVVDPFTAADCEEFKKTDPDFLQSAPRGVKMDCQLVGDSLVINDNLDFASAAYYYLTRIGAQGAKFVYNWNPETLGWKYVGHHTINGYYDDSGLNPSLSTIGSKWDSKVKWDDGSSHLEGHLKFHPQSTNIQELGKISNHSSWTHTSPDRDFFGNPSGKIVRETTASVDVKTEGPFGGYVDRVTLKFHDKNSYYEDGDGSQSPPPWKVEGYELDVNCYARAEAGKNVCTAKLKNLIAGSGGISGTLNQEKIVYDVTIEFTGSAGIVVTGTGADELFPGNNIYRLIQDIETLEPIFKRPDESWSPLINTQQPGDMPYLRDDETVVKWDELTRTKTDLAFCIRPVFGSPLVRKAGDWMIMYGLTNGRKRIAIGYNTQECGA